MIELTFYVFSILLLLSGVLVISSRNSVHAVLFLIFAFFNAAALFILIGAEYIAMTLIIVYVGAVMVLFLFAVMMVDNNKIKTKRRFISILPLSFILCGVIFFEIDWALRQSSEYLVKNIQNSTNLTLHNAQLIGKVMFTDYFLQFQLVGLILLVAMIGSILLTLRHSKVIKRQNIYMQINRSRETAISMAKPEFNKGVELK